MAYVIVAFLWLGGLVWIIGSTIVRQSSAEAIFRETPEYQCIEAAGGKSPRVRWSTLKNLRYTNTSFTVGTLIEKPDTDCIANGDAISFALLPEGPGEQLAVIRITGAEVRADFRGAGQWADVTDADGVQRWRNDGNGYRKVSP